MTDHIVPSGSVAAQGIAQMPNSPLTSIVPVISPHPQMLSTPNFIEWYLLAYGDWLHFEEFMMLGTKMVNQLTGLVTFNLDRHVQARRRGLDAFPLRGAEHHPPTLDQRNAQDEYARGGEHRDNLTEEQGFTRPMLPLELAGIYNSLRVFLYEILQEKNDMLPSADDLLFTGAQSYAGFTSVESTMDSMAQRDGVLNDERIRAIERNSATFKRSVEQAITAAKEQAGRFQAARKDRAIEVVTEARGLIVHGDETLFMRLSKDDRLNYAERVLRALVAQLTTTQTRGAIAVSDDAVGRLKVEMLTAELAIEFVNGWLRDHGTDPRAAQTQVQAMEARLRQMRKPEIKPRSDASPS